MSYLYRSLLSLLLLVTLSPQLSAEGRCPQEISAPGYLQRLQSQAAEQDQGAMLALADLYQKGLCLPHDAEKARQLYEKLAQKGHPEAEFRLGLIYLNGYGVKKNFIIAEELFHRAIAHGHPKARQFLDYLYEVGFDDC